MKYLKLEICLLLDKIGCTSDSSAYYKWSYDVPSTSIVFDTYKIDPDEDAFDPAFTWDDICTKENAIKIWGEEDYEIDVSFDEILNEDADSANLSEDVWTNWEYELQALLHKKLAGQDWEAELVKVLTPPKE
jgi:hypothetical protein